MILLDTNVVSEPMRRHPERRVQDWLDAQEIETLYFPTIGLAELHLGIENLPVGRRRTVLSSAIEDLLARLFRDRIVAFDIAAAKAYGAVVTRARRNGHAISVADGQIAAIAASRNFAVATRDEAPFVAAGLDVINPWAG
jgi:toxin FitB